MGKVKVVKSPDAPRKRKPALTPEGTENQLISLAVDLAFKKLEDGTASNSLILEIVKRGMGKERLEKEILAKQKELIEAKTQALKDSQKLEEVYKEAMEVMRIYSGNGGSRDD